MENRNEVSSVTGHNEVIDSVVNKVMGEDVASETKNTYEIKILDTNKPGWYSDIKLTKNDEIFKIKEVNLSAVDNFKIHGMISSYHSYVDYFNKLIMLTSHKPESIEYLNKVNDVDVLTAIEDIDKAILNLREKILVVESEVHNLILAKILSKEVIIEKFTVSSIIKDFFSSFKIKNKFKPKTYIATL